MSNLKEFNITTLKRIARQRRIPGYSKFRQGQEDELRRLILESQKSLSQKIWSDVKAWFNSMLVQDDEEYVA